ncbi:MAG: NAD(P)H-hydrate dehydratase [Candidatus Omnitrophica bacterium]|nr:NAD(P)H-hydrate dehydratase [Candidatus Omnitrophota bacterium]
MTSVKELMKAVPKRRADSNKGDFGHVFVIAGSAGYTGAAYLASQAAVRSGSGLATLAIPGSLYGVMAAKLTEVMVRPYSETKERSFSLGAEGDLLRFAKKCNSFVIGPGLSQNKETGRLVRRLVAKLERPVVLDADGINSFCDAAAELKKSGGSLVLTPHPGELSRLIGKSVKEIQRNRKDVALQVAREYNIVLVLKGHDTVVAGASGRVYINKTGNPGMASGGVGDILAGVIAAFVAQGVETFSAAALGTYFHGLAGDMALKEKGPLGLIATDLLEKLPEALKVLG